jgi:diguanylate cyclase (GGDEF)-like protein/PAS domain S-box-containing protein
MEHPDRSVAQGKGRKPGPAISGALLDAAMDDVEAMVVFVELPSRRISVLRGSQSFGYSVEDVERIGPLQLFVYEDRGRVEALVVGLFRDAIPLASLEVVMHDAFGNLRPVLLTLRPVDTAAQQGVLVSLVELRSSRTSEQLTVRRRKLNAVVERASHRVALSAHADLASALDESAGELAEVLGATTLSFWTTNANHVLEQSAWGWPHEVAQLAPALKGIRVDFLAERIRSSSDGVIIIRSSELDEDSPLYLRWVRLRGGALIGVTRTDLEGRIRVLSYHVNDDDPQLHPDEVHAARNAFEIIGNAIERRTLSKAIEDNARWSQAVLESSSDMLGVLDIDTTIKFASASVADLGYDRVELLGRRALDLVHPDDVCAATALVESPAPKVLRFLTADGSWRHLECRVRNLIDDPTINGLLLNARDVTDRITFERTVAAFASAQQLLSSVTTRLSAALPGELLSELRSGLVELASFSRASRAGLWWSKTEGVVDIEMFVGADGTDLRPEGSFALTVPQNLPALSFERATDASRPVFDAMVRPDLPPIGALMASPFVGPTGHIGMLTLAFDDPNFEPDDAIRRAVPAFAQIVTTAMLRHDAEQRLRFQATTDVVTGLANRAVMRNRLEADFAGARENGTSVALLLLDLDDFKLVNDGYGHQAGDDLLRQFGNRLRSICGSDDLVARLGGDEFVVIRTGHFDVSHIGDLATRIAHALRDPFELDGRRFTVSSSIGISILEADDNEADTADLLRRADIAMYQAKRRGPGETERFDQRMGEAARGNAIIRADLDQAITNGDIDVLFQPIVETTTGRRRGAEALARWLHPTLGLLSPDMFIPVAERSGLISALGMLVLNKSVEMLADLKQNGLVEDDFYLSVNVAARQLHETDFQDLVFAALNRYGLSPRCIRLEITESSLVDRALLDCMHNLRRAGLRLAIDDFGTGYSSLASLQDLPVDVLKIDRSFVQRIDTDRQAAALVAAVVTMANTLGLETVAEGVETEGQRAALASFGCPLSQGYLFDRPLRGDDWRRTSDVGSTEDDYSAMAVRG